MRKFKCESCKAECELIMAVNDLEDMEPYRCPVSKALAGFKEVFVENEETTP